MISLEEVARIDQTLTTLNGNRSLAAQALGIPLPRLQNHINQNRALAAKWLGRVDMPVATPDRDKVKLDFEDLDSPPPGVKPADVTSANAQNQIDLKLQKLGWEGLGITGNTAQLMESFEKFTGGKILRTIDATHGGMMFGFAKTAERFDYLSKKLDDHRNKVELLSPEMEALTHTQFMECADQMRKFNAEATKAAHVRALIAEKANDAMNKGKKKKAKWDRRGGGPKQVTPSQPPRTPHA